MIKKIISAALILLSLSLTACSSLHSSANGTVTQGQASWYGKDFHRKRTASGERYNMYQLTAAHRTLPFATKVRVTNLHNGRQVVVRINDRGPFSHHRIIDLSYAAAKQLGMLAQGSARVNIQIV